MRSASCLWGYIEESRIEESFTEESRGALRIRLTTVVLAALFVLQAAPVLAQGCAMCYSTAKATSKDGQRAITRGVIILAIPPLSVVTIGVGLAFRYSRKRDQDHERDAQDRNPFTS